jgi:hypothetical protein
MGNTHLERGTIICLKNDLDNFKKAFYEMANAWMKAEYDNPEITDQVLVPDYPFNTSFDDLAGDVRTWVGLCKGRLLDELLKAETNGKNERSVSED